MAAADKAASYLFSFVHINQEEGKKQFAWVRCSSSLFTVWVFASACYRRENWEECRTPWVATNRYREPPHGSFKEGRRYSNKICVLFLLRDHYKSFWAYGFIATPSTENLLDSSSRPSLTEHRNRDQRTKLDLFNHFKQRTILDLPLALKCKKNLLWCVCVCVPIFPE